MKPIDWKGIDDYRFVRLVADLLSRFGFVAISSQGIGPDGGVDLLATEFIPFVIQGRVPFRWAIQCKFSEKGQKAPAVNATEVQDVEGILRSSRFASEQLRGYMLITNRKVAQNVIERLNGIDQSSQFRTARIDGAQLETMLDGQQGLLDFYFDIDAKLRKRFGEPTMLVPASDIGGPSLPSFSVELISDSDPYIRCALEAIVDTGAAISAIPVKAAIDLGLPPTGMIKMWGILGGGATEYPKYSMKIQIGSKLLPFEAVGWERHDVLLGQNFLKNFTIVLRPNGGLEFFSDKRASSY